MQIPSNDSAQICKRCSEDLVQAFNLKERIVGVNQIYFDTEQNESTNSFDKFNISMFDDSFMSSVADENDSCSFNDIKAYNTESSSFDGSGASNISSNSFDDSSVSNSDSNSYNNSSFADLIEESDQKSYKLCVKRSRNFDSVEISKHCKLNRQPYPNETLNKWCSSGKIVQSTPIKSLANKQTFKTKREQHQVLGDQDYFNTQNAEPLFVNSWTQGSDEPDQPYTFKDSKGEIRLKFNNQIFINTMQQMKMNGTRYLYWSCLMKYNGECDSKVISIKLENKHIICGLPSEHQHEVNVDHLRPSRDLPEAEIITNGYQARYNGYTYNKSYNGEDSKSSAWRCIVKACFGMIFTIGSKVTHSADSVHNHPSASSK